MSGFDLTVFLRDELGGEGEGEERRGEERRGEEKRKRVQHREKVATYNESTHN